MLGAKTQDSVTVVIAGELDHFAAVFRQRDLEAVRLGLEQSERVMDILSRARAHCGLTFAADKR